MPAEGFSHFKHGNSLGPNILHPPLSADETASTDFLYIFDPSSNLSSVRGTRSRAPFHHSRDLERSTYSTPNSLCYQPNHREHLERRPGSYGLGENPRDPREAIIPDRSIQIFIATIYMRRIITVERTMGTEIKLVGKVETRAGQIAARACARGMRLKPILLVADEAPKTKHPEPIFQGVKVEL